MAQSDFSSDFSGQEESQYGARDQGIYTGILLSNTHAQLKIYIFYWIVAIPLLKDLIQRVTPRYAADWKRIGILLNLPIGELNAIEAGYPTNVKWCCDRMLEKWLETDLTASWKRMLTAIQSCAVPGDQSDDKGS